jgi:hypothetical protein
LALVARRSLVGERSRVVLRVHDATEFPTAMRPPERAREASRETLQGRDPFLAALPLTESGALRSTVVLEAAAIKTSSVGQTLLRCLSAEMAARLRDRVGFGPEDVERLAFSEDLVVMAGDFAGAKLVAGGRTPMPHGAHGTIYVRSSDADTEPVVAALGNRVLLYGRLEIVKAAIGRMEGSLSGPPAVSEAQAYGDAYGTFPIEKLAQLVEQQQPQLASRLRSVVSRVEFHAAAVDDVLFVVDLASADAQAVAEIRGGLQALLDAVRAAPKSDAPELVADLLQTVRLDPLPGALRIEGALPLASIQNDVARCSKVEAGTARR